MIEKKKRVIIKIRENFIIVLYNDLKKIFVDGRHFLKSMYIFIHHPNTNNYYYLIVNVKYYL